MNPYTTLTETDDYRVEYESKMLSIVHKASGQAVSLTGKRIAGDFRDCLQTHTPDRVIRTYMRLAKSAGANWQPMYKV
jgi:hypothetical protein